MGYMGLDLSTRALVNHQGSGSRRAVWDIERVAQVEGAIGGEL